MTTYSHISSNRVVLIASARLIRVITRTASTFVLAVLLLGPGRIVAQLISSESFQYPAGAITGRNGGTGWSGPWFNSPLNSTDNTIDTAGLAMLPQIPSMGGKNYQIGSDVRNFRYLDTTSSWLAPYLVNGTYGKTFGKESTTIWISFLIACNSYPTTAYGGLHLMDGVGDVTQDIFGFKQLHQRFQFGRDNSHANYIMARVTNGLPGGATWQGHVLCDKQVRLLVHRIDFHSGPEEAWMWVDPPAGSDPDTALADLHAPNITDFKFNAVNIGSGSSAKFSFDELRIGTTYQSVVPGSIAGVGTHPAAGPAFMTLEQNYPNPFNPSTTIGFNVGPGETFVVLSVFDLLGREVTRLVADNRPAGYYRVTWDASDVPGGVYFVRMIATPGRTTSATPGEREKAAYTDTRKIILIK